MRVRKSLRSRLLIASLVMQLAVVFALKVLVCNLKLSNMATFLTVRQLCASA
jgi:hypothetical protein